MPTRNRVILRPQFRRQSRQRHMPHYRTRNHKESLSVQGWTVTPSATLPCKAIIPTLAPSCASSASVHLRTRIQLVEVFISTRLRSNYRLYLIRRHPLQRSFIISRRFGRSIRLCFPRLKSIRLVWLKESLLRWPMFAQILFLQ